MKGTNCLPTILEVRLGDADQLWPFERIKTEVTRCLKLVDTLAKDGLILRHSELGASLRSSEDALICVIQLVKPPLLPILEYNDENDFDWEAQFLVEKEKIVTAVYEALSAFDGWKLQIAHNATAPFLNVPEPASEDDASADEMAQSPFIQFLMDGTKLQETMVRLPGGDWRQATLDGFELITWEKGLASLQGRALRTSQGVKLELLGAAGKKGTRPGSVQIRFAGLPENIREHIDRQCHLQGKLKLIGHVGTFTGYPATRYFLPTQIVAKDGAVTANSDFTMASENGLALVLRTP